MQEDGVTVDRRDGAAVASYQVPVNENKSIYAEISLVLSQDGSFTGEWKRLSWRTQAEEGPRRGGRVSQLIAIAGGNIYGSGADFKTGGSGFCV